MASSAGGCFPPTRANRTPLSLKETIAGFHYINTGPIILLSHRPDRKVRSGQLGKFDYWISSPDTYPNLTVLSVWTNDRKIFHAKVPPGSIFRLIAVQVDRRFDDDLANEELRFRMLGEGPPTAHLNSYDRQTFNNHHSPWYYVYGHAQDPNVVRDQDWEEVRGCMKVWKHWTNGGEAKFRDLIRRLKEEQEEKAQLQLLLMMEEKIRLEEERNRKKREEEENKLLELAVAEGEQEESMGAYEGKLFKDSEPEPKKKVMPPPVRMGKQAVRAKAVEQVKRMTEAQRKAEARWAEETEYLREQGKLWGGPGGDRFWKLDGLY